MNVGKSNLTRKKTSKTRKLGEKSYSLLLGRLLALRRELSEQKHAQLAALLMQKIIQKLEELGFPAPAKKLKAKLGESIEGLYQDITEEKKKLFLDTATQYWQKGYEQNEAKKMAIKAQKRAATLARLAEASKQRSLQRKQAKEKEN